MERTLCLVLLVAMQLFGARIASAEKIAADTTRKAPPSWLQLGLGVGEMTRKTGLAASIGFWLPYDWPLLGISFNSASQINSAFESSPSSRRGDIILDLAPMAGARHRGDLGWVYCALGPAYFRETRRYGTDDFEDFSGLGGEVAFAFGYCLGRGGLGASLNMLFSSGLRRLSVGLVGEISLSN
jgi:hypothetical protein